jgi:hypothetical protein
MATEDRQQASEARTVLISFRDTLSDAYVSTECFRNSIQQLPRMTVVLNRAKRQTAAVLKDILESIDEGRRIATEAVKALDALLGE